MDRSLAQKIKHVSLFCSFLVCYNHAFTLTEPYTKTSGEAYAFADSFIQNLVKYNLARITTPFFFCLSAFLLFTAILSRSEPSSAGSITKQYRPEVGKRVRSLLIPYLLWCGFSFALVGSLQLIPGLRPYFTQALIELPFLQILDKLFWSPVAYPLWFLRDLFIMVACWPLFHLALRNRRIALLALLTAAVAWFLWFDVRATRAILFFGFGAFLAIHRPSIPTVSRFMASGLLVVWLVIAAMGSLHIMYAGLEHFALNNLAIVFGLLTVWTGYDHVSSRLRNRRWLEQLSGFTFFIYVAHEPLATFLRKAAGVVAAENHLLLLTFFFASGLILFFGSACTGMLLLTYFPSVYQLLTGGRAKRTETAVTSMILPQVGDQCKQVGA
jgi:hypothetical protein